MGKVVLFDNQQTMDSIVAIHDPKDEMGEGSKALNDESESLNDRYFGFN